MFRRGDLGGSRSTGLQGVALTAPAARRDVSEASSSFGPAPSAGPLSPEERRWLHDKYERLAAEEGQLAAGRTSYFAAIASVLFTGMVVATAYFSNRPEVLALVVTFLSVVGILISFVWVVLLHRTNDAQLLWREAAARLEEVAPPLMGELEGAITLRSGRALKVNLLTPYHAHRARFARKDEIGWMDRIQPGRISEFLPVAFLIIWAAVTVIVWVWYATG